MSAAGHERRRTMPPGGRLGFFNGPDGAALRYGLWAPLDAQPLGSVLVLGGRGEFIEKHFETYADLRDRGFGVATIDWRGQGLSARWPGLADKDHLTDYRMRRADLDLFVRQILRRKLPGPYYAIAHSMGGHIMAHHLHDHPNDFARAVLCSPMIAVKFSPLMRAVSAALTALMHRLGRDDAYLPGQGPYEGQRRGYESRDFLTTDPDRYRDEVLAIEANPALAPGGMTFGWLRATMASVRALNAPGYPEAIATPMLVLLSEDERLVDNDAAIAFAQRAPDARVVTIAGARHELLKENDQIRRQIWGQIMRFFKTPTPPV